MKPQRVRDPIHDLIEFGNSEFEQSLWSILDSAEFQRLRRVRQLGFSELVYPGATHTRFAHSVGVFHTARQMTSRVADLLGGGDPERSKIAQTAALIHDVGHGPFSHAFESAVKELNKLEDRKENVRHEFWTAEIIRKDTDLGLTLRNKLGQDTREAVAELLTEDPTDVYSAIVSSQFDADRLDYVRRDRFMTGANYGVFDYSWLFANMEVADVPVSIDDEQYSNIQSLVLGNKAFQAAEAYVLGLFHLYFTVYFHKTTRSAEKILTAIVVRIGKLIRDDGLAQTGLHSSNPIVQFVNERSLASYLKLDDSVIWYTLRELENSRDPILSDFAKRLLTRKLYKSIEVAEGGAFEAKFRAEIFGAMQAGEFDETELFVDRPSREPYKRRGFDRNDASSRVLISDPNGHGLPVDIAERSEVVRALSKKSLLRVYVRDQIARDKVNAILGGIKK